MAVKPEIRGLWLMATRCFENENFDSALQYFSLAMKRHAKCSKARIIFEDMAFLALALNTSVTLCHLNNFSDAYRIVKMAFFYSEKRSVNVVLRKDVPFQFIHVLIRIVALSYLDSHNEQSEAMAAKYLSLIRQSYFSNFRGSLTPNDASIIFLVETMINNKSCEVDRRSSFHDGIKELAEVNQTNCREINNCLLHLSGETSTLPRSLSAIQIEHSVKGLPPLDKVCFLNNIGASYAQCGRILLAIEALERALAILNQPSNFTSDHDDLIRTVLEAAVSNNLALFYHSIDSHGRYKKHWEYLRNSGVAALQQVLETFDGPITPKYIWALRYFTEHNFYSHMALVGKWNDAMKGFQHLIDEELVDMTRKLGFSDAPILRLEIRLCLAMLAAATDNFDLSWRLFLFCFDDITAALAGSEDPAYNALNDAYLKTMDEMYRCLPPSHVKSEEFANVNDF